ncbi:helix-turn-helix domain-containing protein [Anaerobium acetethylicum]|uniref:Transcriptional regulator, contains XRE-family HTH domain n=1 Tax=Anaerobium acetethylicum TaxID=1619234 RepID=A0A1D3TWI5_9FIRM|nr:helix-turn-helix transcriptional regulator [Anaerobium acetethylicum]SCP98603.1 Transcriptional regulator, contains XRE-family HTH domain [Anaerobium acetethylicum]
MEYEGWKVGQEIRKLRNQKNMTIEELSFKLGMSTSHINQLELGSRKMSIDLLYKIMGELEADANTVLAIPVKSEKRKGISIDAELEGIPSEKKMYLMGIFSQMIQTFPGELC